jgi:hypothetical protein
MTHAVVGGGGEYPKLHCISLEIFTSLNGIVCVLDTYRTTTGEWAEKIHCSIF